MPYEYGPDIIPGAIVRRRKDKLERLIVRRDGNEVFYQRFVDDKGVGKERQCFIGTIQGWGDVVQPTESR